MNLNGITYESRHDKGCLGVNVKNKNPAININIVTKLKRRKQTKKNSHTHKAQLYPCTKRQGDEQKDIKPYKTKETYLNRGTAL